MTTHRFNAKCYSSNHRGKIYLTIILIFLHLISFANNPLEVAGTPDFTAVQSGNWSSASTWGGNLPTTNSRILIPQGVTITVDAEITEAFKSIRVDGELRFATNVNTGLNVEYLVSSMSGRIEIGTDSSPVAPNVTTKIMFADLGGTSIAEDSERYAPGAVFMGPVEMRGHEKMSWSELLTFPQAGATSLVLKSAPMNWEVGDKIVIAGTEIGNFESDEVATISAISGNTIQLSNPLARAHQPPAEANDLNVHVVNLSRNIQIFSENTSVSAKRRGHLMFMHNLNVKLKFIEITNLGRTDKSIPLDDYSWDDLQESPDYSPPRGAYNNPRGRYSVHFHRGGVDPTLSPAIVEGVTVNNDPGWAYVNHSSRVEFLRNASYNVTGGAFNTEAGDETGSFIENIAIRTVNSSNPLSNPRDTSALVDLREQFQDFAWQGDAFWFHSTGVTVKGNIASGVSGHGFIFWPEGLIEKGIGMKRANPSIHIPNSSQEALLNGVASNFILECWLIPSQPFTNNTVYNSSKGIMGYYVQTRFLDTSEEKNNIPTETYRQSLNFIIDSSVIWNIRNKGIDFAYASDVTIQNSRIVGYNSPKSAVGIDVDHWHNLDDWMFFNNRIEGFDNGNVGLSVPSNANITIEGGVFDNVSTDIKIRETNFVSNTEDLNDVASRGILNRTMMISDITFNQPDSNIVMAPEFTLNQEAQDGVDFPDEEKSLLYFLLNDCIILNYGPFNNNQLYFNHQRSTFVPITNDNYFLNVPEGDDKSKIKIPRKYRNKTNYQLQKITSMPPTSFGGVIMPRSAQSHPGIVAGKVDTVTLNFPPNSASYLDADQLDVYPNPASGSFSVRGNSLHFAIVIFDAQGKLCKRLDHVPYASAIDISDLRAGVYYMRITKKSEFSVVIKKIVVF